MYAMWKSSYVGSEVNLMSQAIPVGDRAIEENDATSGFLLDANVTGVMSVVQEILLFLENSVPLLVIVWWKRAGERTVCDKLIAVMCLTFIFSSIIPTPLSIVADFIGSWHGDRNVCECYQVTATWCTLSSLAIVTFICVDHHMVVYPLFTHNIRAHCRDNVVILLMLLYSLTLTISTLPLIGFGPDVRSDNSSCVSWILLTPTQGYKHVFYICYLSFGYLNMLVCTYCGSFFLVLLHKPILADRLVKKKQVPVEEGVSQLLRSRRSPEDTSWLVVSLVLLLQITWLPFLVLLTLQKAGVHVSETVIMCGLLATSLPGLLNPLLYGLMLKSYRDAYKTILSNVCASCRIKRPELQALKGLPGSRPDKNSDRKRIMRVSIRDYNHTINSTNGSSRQIYRSQSVTELLNSEDSSDEEDSVKCDEADDDVMEDNRAEYGSCERTCNGSNHQDPISDTLSLESDSDVNLIYGLLTDESVI